LSLAGPWGFLYVWAGSTEDESLIFILTRG